MVFQIHSFQIFFAYLNFVHSIQSLGKSGIHVYDNLLKSLEIVFDHLWGRGFFNCHMKKTDKGLIVNTLTTTPS